MDNLRIMKPRSGPLASQHAIFWLGKERPPHEEQGWDGLLALRLQHEAEYREWLGKRTKAELIEFIIEDERLSSDLATVTAQLQKHMEMLEDVARRAYQGTAGRYGTPTAEIVMEAMEAAEYARDQVDILADRRMGVDE